MPRRFLFIRWGTKAVRQEILSRNPHTKIVYAEYVKIRDGLVAVSLLETNLCRRNGHGNSLFFLMNLKEMHDVGRSFGTSGEGADENYTFGAFGAWFDASEVKGMDSMYYLH